MIGKLKKMAVLYQAFPSEDGHVDVLQGAVIVLENLSRPQGAVDVRPLVLADVQKPATLLETREGHVIPLMCSSSIHMNATSDQQYACVAQVEVLTHVCVFVSVLEAQNAQPVVAHTRGRRELWTIVSV